MLAASGFRATAQRGHHVVTWQALPELMGAGIGDTAVYFDSCRTLRNRSDYDRVGVVSEAEVDEVLREANAFAIRSSAGSLGSIRDSWRGRGRGWTSVAEAATAGGPHGRAPCRHLRLVRRADGPQA